MSTNELIKSLAPGQAGSLKVKPDGTVLDGHHRIKVLRERSVDVDALPREIVPGCERIIKMSDTIFWIDGPRRGRLAIVTRPRGGDWLEDDMTSWRRAGLDLIVSLLTADESAELGLEREGEIAHRQGLEYISFPIADRNVPTSWEDAHKLVQQLTTRLAEGKQIGVHCRLGIGRSALLAASLLVNSAVGVGPAFERIEKARGCPVPDTPEQRLWVEQFGTVTVREEEMPTEAGPMVKGAT